MNPIDYSINVENPMQSVLQGYQTGLGLRNIEAQRAQQEAAARSQAEMAAELNSVASNKNATAQDYIRLQTKYPSLSKSLEAPLASMNAQQREAKIAQAVPVLSAALSGKHDIAAARLDEIALGYKNSGRMDEATATEKIAADMRSDPARAQLSGALFLSSAMGADKFTATFGDLGKETRASAEAPADLAKKVAEAAKLKSEAVIKGSEAAIAPEKNATDLANVKSQINERTKRLALDRDKFTSELQLKLAEFKQKQGELPEYVAKDVNGAITEAVAAKQSAEGLESLADRIDQARLNSGPFAKLDEITKKVAGSQNEFTRIRSEYTRIVTQQAMAAYKKVATGSTSDKDIETAMTRVPKDTDSPELMASFLRGAAKLQKYDSALKTAQAEWLGANKSLSKANRDIEIDGVKVPAGSSFKDFSEQYVAQKIGVNNGKSLVDSLAAKYGAIPQ